MAELAGGESAVMTGEAVALSVRPLGFVLRAAGTLIDVVAVWLFFLGWMLAVSAASRSLDPALVQALVTVGTVLAFVAAPMLVETLSHGRSLGRLAVGGRIVRDDGGAAGPRHAFIRALTGVVEIYLTFGGLAALVGLLSARSKRLGDLLAGTYSQQERVPRPVSFTPAVPLALTGWAGVADVGTLPDPLARRIRNYLVQSPAMTPDARTRASTELAREAAVFVAPLPPVDAHTFLLAVSAMRRDRDTAALRRESDRLARVAPVLAALPHGVPRR